MDSESPDTPEAFYGVFSGNEQTEGSRSPGNGSWLPVDGFKKNMQYNKNLLILRA